jgi:hypothetical protein
MFARREDDDGMTGRVRGTALAVAGSLLIFAATQASAQSADDLVAARRLVGMWRLVDRTVTFADGTTRPDPRTTAYIFYSDTGMTCYIAMDPTRARWKSETTPTPDEAVASIMGLGAYCGTFRVDAKEGSVVHHMDIERIPNLVGRDRKRWFMFQDADHLILKVDPSEFRAPVVERRLLWERVPVKRELASR